MKELKSLKELSAILEKQNRELRAIKDGLLALSIKWILKKI